MILGYLETNRKFPDLVLEAFADTETDRREQSFARIAYALAAARGRYDNVKRIDQEFAPAGEGDLDGRIGSPFLERLVTARLERPAIAAVLLPAGLPAPLPERLPVLLNAVRAGDPERRRVTARYLVAELRVMLQGEELSSALVTLTIRLQDGARTAPFRVSGAHRIATAPVNDRERDIAGAALRSWRRAAARAHPAAPGRTHAGGHPRRDRRRTVRNARAPALPQGERDHSPPHDGRLRSPPARRPSR